MKTHLFCLLCLCLVACNKESDSSKLLQVNFDDKEEIVDLAYTSDSMNFIALETNDTCLISMMLKIAIDDSSLFIQDKSQKILVFNKNGSFKFLIDRLGLGPGEYTSIQDFWMNGNFIEIMDLHSRKIHRYSKHNGNHVKSFQLKTFVYSIYPANDGFYLADLPLNVGDGTFGVYLLDSLYTEERKLLSYSGNYPIFAQSPGIFSRLSRDTFGICSQVESSIYHYSYPTLEKKYSIDFKGKTRISSRKGKDMKDLTESEMMNIPNILFYKENSRFLFVTVSDNASVSTVVYDKLKDDLRVANMLNYKSNFTFIHLMTNTPDVLCFYAPAESLFEVKNRNDILGVIGKESLSIIENIKADDNPVLQILYLKKSL
jgi:hypothetical protein